MTRFRIVPAISIFLALTTTTQGQVLEKELAIGECQYTFDGQTHKVCRENDGRYQVLAADTAHSDPEIVSHFYTRLSKINANDQTASEQFNTLNNDFRNYSASLPPTAAGLSDLREKIAAKRKEIVQMQAARDRAAEAESPALKRIALEYPDLLDRIIWTDYDPATGSPIHANFGKFILCMEADKDANDWGISRNENGVEVAGLLYGQRVALNFLDHGQQQQLELIAATYGAKVSLEFFQARSVLQEILSRCHGILN